ncbi:MAG: ArnT family glycosyltransferase [bacterium]
MPTPVLTQNWSLTDKITYQNGFFLIVGILTFVRIFVLIFSQINLGPDEAQYWWWSQTPDFGYFTKPPMIAWLIGLTSSVFGDAEWAIRLSSPILVTLTSLLIYASANYLYDQRTAFWAGLMWIIMPAILLGTGIISTDIPLLFFWSVGLYAFIRLADSGNVFYALLLGAALGFGMLSKYAMIYFPLGVACAFALSPYARQSLRLVNLLLAGLIAGLIFAPNIVWNMQHDFQTLSHTSANANWGGQLFQISELGDFLGSQFMVIGPFLFAYFIWALFRLKKRHHQAGRDWDKDKLLLAFAIPPLLIISVQAFISRAHANWAIAAYPSLIILLTVWIIRAQRSSLLKLSALFHASLAGLLMYGAMHLSFLDQLGMSNSLKRVRGWEEQAAQIAHYAKDYPAIVADDREMMGDLLYYMRDYDIPIYAWDMNRIIDNHYEAFQKFQPTKYETALFISKYPDKLYKLIEFDNIIYLGQSSVDTFVRCPRVYSLYEISAYNKQKALAPLPEDKKNNDREPGHCKAY